MRTAGGDRLIARVDNVTMRYGDKIVLEDCSLDVVKGAITCVIGLSGAGKSTILRLLNGLRRPERGHVYVKGVDICHMPERELIDFRSAIGFAFQFAALLDSMTVVENISLPLHEHTRMAPDEIEETAKATLDSV
ncbi:MAG: ATP-binding cassette domain-containing protein, partial [Candidatus Eremiobacteraeota bacterium]|nr:ATP-binding cassette domain-containing protein [Candidatus Eremiobacteraeota bacterium]